MQKKLNETMDNAYPINPKKSSLALCYLFYAYWATSGRPQSSPTHPPSKQNRNFRPKGEGRSGRRPLLPKRKLNILVDLTLGKSYHSVVTFLHAQKIKCYTFSIQTLSKLISYYVCPWKVGP